MKNSSTLLIVAIAMLSGCASIVEGTSQDIALNLTPEVAACDAFQQGRLVGTYDHVRRTISVPKSRYDMELRCIAPGYKPKFVQLVSEASAWGVVGALTLDFGLVDYATGALNKYPASLQIVMEEVS